MPDSGTISGPGPERHPKSGLARLFDKNPQLAHPYARLSEKHKDNKRRKIWSHTLEKNFFTPEEMYVPSQYLIFAAHQFSHDQR